MAVKNAIIHKRHKDHDTIRETIRTSVSLDVGVFGKESAQKAMYNELVPIDGGVNDGVTRPFITPQFFFNRKYIEGQIPKIMSHKATKSTWDGLGTKLGLEMIKYVDDKSNFVPNAPSTVDKKGFNYALHETNDMVNDIDYDIKKVRR